MTFRKTCLERFERTLDVWASFPKEISTTTSTDFHIDPFKPWGLYHLQIKRWRSPTQILGSTESLMVPMPVERFLQVVSTVWWGDHDATSGGAFQNSQWGAFGFQAGQRWGSGVDSHLKMVPDMEIWFMTYLTVDFLFWWELHHFGGEMLCENNERRGSFKPFLLKYVLMWCGFLIRVSSLCQEHQLKLLTGKVHPSLARPKISRTMREGFSTHLEISVQFG